MATGRFNQHNMVYDKMMNAYLPACRVSEEDRKVLIHALKLYNELHEERNTITDFIRYATYKVAQEIIQFDSEIKDIKSKGGEDE